MNAISNAACSALVRFLAARARWSRAPRRPSEVTNIRSHRASLDTSRTQSLRRRGRRRRGRLNSPHGRTVEKEAGHVRHHQDTDAADNFGIRRGRGALCVGGEREDSRPGAARTSRGTCPSCGVGTAPRRRAGGARAARARRPGARRTPSSRQRVSGSTYIDGWLAGLLARAAGATNALQQTGVTRSGPAAELSPALLAAGVDGAVSAAVSLSRSDRSTREPRRGQSGKTRPRFAAPLDRLAAAGVIVPVPPRPVTSARRARGDAVSARSPTRDASRERVLHLCPAPVARAIKAGAALRDDPFQPVADHRMEQRLTVVERVGETSAPTPPARMSKRRDDPIRVFMPFLGVRTVGGPAWARCLACADGQSSGCPQVSHGDVVEGPRRPADEGARRASRRPPRGTRLPETRRLLFSFQPNAIIGPAVARGRHTWDSGQTMAEYAVILAGIAVVCVVAALFVGATIKGRVDSTDTPTPAAPFTPPPPPQRHRSPTRQESRSANTEAGTTPSSRAKPIAGTTSTATSRRRPVTPPSRRQAAASPDPFLTNG